MPTARCADRKCKVCEDGCADECDHEREDSLILDPNDPRRRWDSRLVRLSQLAELHHPSRRHCASIAPSWNFRHGVSARDRARHPARSRCLALTAEMPSLFSLVDRHGPELLREAAHQWELSGEQRWCQALQSVLDHDHTPSAGADDFFTRTCLQPIAENLQLQYAPEPNLYRVIHKDRRKSCPKPTQRQEVNWIEQASDSTFAVNS